MGHLANLNFHNPSTRPAAYPDHSGDSLPPILNGADQQCMKCFELKCPLQRKLLHKHTFSHNHIQKFEL